MWSPEFKFITSGFKFLHKTVQNKFCWTESKIEVEEFNAIQSFNLCCLDHFEALQQDCYINTPLPLVPPEIPDLGPVPCLPVSPISPDEYKNHEPNLRGAMPSVRAGHYPTLISRGRFPILPSTSGSVKSQFSHSSQKQSHHSQQHA